MPDKHWHMFVGHSGESHPEYIWCMNAPEDDDPLTIAMTLVLRYKGFAYDDEEGELMCALKQAALADKEASK